MKPATARAPEATAKRSERANVRTGLDAEAIGQALIDNLHCLQAKAPQHATRNDWYMALAYTVRDRMLDRYIKTVEAIAAPNTATKVVAYLSAEFLTGPHLGNSLIALGIWEAARQALSRVGQDLVRRPGPGRRAGPRQWGARPAGRVLHGLAGDPQRSGHRLRHPLRVRHLRSSDSRRLAGGADRQVAALRQPLGNRALGDCV